jgi:transposase InsO family protein
LTIGVLGTMLALFYVITEPLMPFILQPWQMYLVILAGWINRQQQDVIEYLRTENQVLKETLGKKRILLNDDQRRRLAIKGKILGRKRLAQVGMLFTPDTILRWHRMLVADKWDYSEHRQSLGRPRVGQEIVDLVLQCARENPSWGYDRIQGALANLGHNISDQTVGNILKRHGIEPVRDRKRQTTWKTFIKSHWDVLAAIDFTTIEVWTKGGLVTYYLLFVMEVATRRVHFAGCTPNPNEAWMKQIARNLTDMDDGFLNGKRYVLVDRDGKFCPAFRDILQQQAVDCVRLPPRSPNLTPHIERFIRSIKDECLSRMIFFGENMLRNAVGEYLEHYHHERNHQGFGNQIIEPAEEIRRAEGKIQRRQRLGGILNYYYRDAA